MRKRRRIINRVDRDKYLRERREKSKKQIETHRKNMEKIRNSPGTKQIVYPEYKEAFDYVDNLFPGSNVKNVTLYKVGPKFLERLGYGGAGGFYDKDSKIIIIASYQPVNKNRCPARYNFSIKAKITKDEVIAHELCHYCFVEEGGSSPSRELWEEFAYGWTLEYLRNKSYSDNEIIKNNYFPFLVDIMSNKALKCILAENDISKEEYNSYSRYRKERFFKRYGMKWHKKRKEFAQQRGEELIKIYDKKIKEGTGCTKKITKTSRFDLIDI